MIVTLIQTTAPTATVVTLDQLKAQCRITSNLEDTLLGAYLVGAQRLVEGRTDRALGAQDLLLVMDAWPDGRDESSLAYLRADIPMGFGIGLGFFGYPTADGVIRLPRPPLVEVASVKYLDPTGTERTVASTDYIVETAGMQGIVFRTPIGSTWPIAAHLPGAIRVAYTAGDPDAVPAPPEALQAILLLAAHWSENREPVSIGSTPMVLPFAVDALIDLAKWHL